MTPSTRPTIRLTPARDAGRNIVHILVGNLMGFRLKGTRKIYWLTVEGGYHQAVKAEAAAKRWEKIKAKKERAKYRR